MAEISASQKRAPLNTDNEHPVQPDDESKQQVELIRTADGWKATRK